MWNSSNGADIKIDNNSGEPIGTDCHRCPPSVNVNISMLPINYKIQLPRINLPVSPPLCQPKISYGGGKVKFGIILGKMANDEFKEGDAYLRSLLSIGSLTILLDFIGT